MSKRAFGELELAILQVIKAGGRVTVKKVHAALGGKDRYTTIMTVMNRLTEKGELLRERNGLYYEYWLKSTDKKSPPFLRSLQQKMVGVKPQALISYLIETSKDLSESDLDEMQSMIEKAREEKKRS